MRGQKRGALRFAAAKKVSSLCLASFAATLRGLASAVLGIRFLIAYSSSSRVSVIVSDWSGVLVFSRWHSNKKRRMVSSLTCGCGYNVSSLQGRADFHIESLSFSSNLEARQKP